MPRKATARKPTEKKVKTSKKVKETPAKKPKKTKAPSKSKKVEPVEEPPVSDVETTEELNTPKKRRVPTKESVAAGFDELVSSIDEEITRLRESQSKSKGVKYLRSLGKKVKTLRGQAARVMKQRQRSTRKNNSNSGFLKPVKISGEMAKFTGWDQKELKSRVDVTKYICQYIRENDLQNPSDRRQILADAKLSKLLKYDADKAKDPLTYYRIQSYIKPHFIKEE